MTNEQLSEQLSVAISGIEAIKQSNERLNSELTEFKAEYKEDIKAIKVDINQIKIDLGKLDTKVSGIDTRLGNEEAISRSVLGVVAGGSILALIKYLLFPS